MAIYDVHVTKLSKIGNSQTIRIPKKLVDQYFPDGEVVIEATEEGLLITPKKDKLSYQNAAIEMAKEDENWRDWDIFQNSGADKLGDW